MTRIALESDSRRIAEIHVASWKVAYRQVFPAEHLERLDVNRREEIWRQLSASSDGPIFVSLEGETITGFCHIVRSKEWEDAAEITAIYLDPEYFRQGHGRELFNRTLVFARERKFPLLILWVLLANSPARRFYEAMGLRADGLLREVEWAGFRLNAMRYGLKLQGQAGAMNETELLERAFYIQVWSERIGCDSSDCRSLRQLIVYNAPSREEADLWARTFVEKDMLPAGEPQYRIVEVKILPIFDRLLTAAGEKDITWPALSGTVNTAVHYSLFPGEFHGSLTMKAPNEHPEAPLETCEIHAARLRQQISNPEEWNWDQAREFLYVLHHESQAFLVRGMNMLLAAYCYLAKVRGTADGDYWASVSVAPEIRNYCENSGEC